MANENTFRKNSSQNSEEEDAVQLFAKQMLQSRFFIGSFQEKRYVANVESYRDVILVSNEEADLIRDLEAVKKRVCGFYTDHWIGISDPSIIGTPSGYAIWTEAPAEIFGKYWYKIRKVQFRHKEVLLKLKIIRPVGVGDSFSKTFLSAEKTEFSKKDTTSSCFASANENLSWFFKTIVTLNNAVESIRFLSVLFVAMLTGLVKFLEYFGDFTLKLLRETSHLVTALTPTLIACINLIAKIIGGFYLLILSMWKTRTPTTVYQSPYVTQTKPMLMGGPNYNTVYYKRALDAPNYRRQTSGGVIITPLD
uniref:Uncharacterized protein n=1 Tax=Photinus pyralis TaxID=7054 RepID=A0A1Y1MGL8_PHOPY